MSKNMRPGAMAVGLLAMTALFAAGPVAAAVRYASPSQSYHASAYPRSCRHYDYGVERWVNVCRTYSSRYVYPQRAPVHPDYYPYRYRYQPPVTDGGPYYGREPYSGYESSFG